MPITARIAKIKARDRVSLSKIYQDQTDQVYKYTNYIQNIEDELHATRSSSPEYEENPKMQHIRDPDQIRNTDLRSNNK